MSMIFQPLVFVGLVENLKQQRGSWKRDLRTKKRVFEYKPYGLISLCFRDLSYLNEGKYFKSYNFVSISAVKPKCFSLCIQYRLNIFQF